MASLPEQHTKNAVRALLPTRLPGSPGTDRNAAAGPGPLLQVGQQRRRRMHPELVIQPHHLVRHPLSSRRHALIPDTPEA